MHVFYLSADQQAYAENLAEFLHCDASTSASSNSAVNLKLDHDGLMLLCQSESDLLQFKLDFSAYRLQRRVKQASQGLVKACQNRHKSLHRLLDLTAGWAQDGYLLAANGFDVTLLEYHPLVFLMLKQALETAHQLQDPVSKNLTLEHSDCASYLQQLQPGAFDCIYLDPMFEQHKSTAKAKKPLQVLQQLTLNQNLEPAFERSRVIAKDRVIVKRARHAANFLDQKPDLVVAEKTIRFDVYLTR